ncbi:Methyltransferase type 11 [Trinorchestia longiramus]|nr:Methyltransferase type 11 [Trinorchestia longiramus]
MIALTRKCASWRWLLHHPSWKFCCTGNPEVVPEHADNDLLQSTRPMHHKEKTRELAIRLHETHVKLRDALYKGEDFKAVWSKHSSDASDLSGYAAAMLNLARKWEKRFLSLKNRNTWIEAMVRRYYYKRLNLVALKEEIRMAKLDPARLTPSQEELIRRLQSTLDAHNEQEIQENFRDLHAGSEDPRTSYRPFNDGQSVTGAAVGLTNILPGDASSLPRDASSLPRDASSLPRDASSLPGDASSLPGDASSLPEALVFSEHSCDSWQLHTTSRVRVLDVGSCYNPLGRYPHLLVTPIDLMPATQDVYKCDFLDVKVVDASEGCDLPPVEGQDAGVDRQIERLPRNYYDVVVFSLVLDYIPCPEARLRCCRKAHQLLRPGGLLLMITPMGVGALNGWLFKWIQLHLTRLGFHRLKKNQNKDGKYRAFTFRKGFFPLLWSGTETKRIESELVSMQHTLKAIKYKAEYDRVDLEKGLYFIRDLKIS